MLDWYRCYTTPILVDKCIGIRGPNENREEYVLMIYGYALVELVDAKGITEIFVSVELELLGCSEWC